mgnify:CR=1 FL=1
MNTSSTDPWEIGPMVAAGTAVAIEPAQEPERRPPAEPEPEPEAEPDARCVDDAGSEGRANTAVDPWEIGPLPSASNPVGNDIPADAPASEPQHVGGAVEPADLADTIDLTPVGEQDAAMPVREWRRMATTAGGILLAACVTVAGMSAWRSHESATAARELEQATADCATARAAAKKAERKLVEYLAGDRLAQAKAVTADKLADPETLETLDKLAEQYSEGERIPACAATDTETANATTSKLQAIEKKHTGNLSRLKKAAGAVFSSRLAHTVEQGERLYSSSRRQGAGRIFSRPAARLHRQARREGHHRRHGQGERLHRREDQGRRGKESAGGGRSGCGGAGAEHAGTATVLVHALRLRFGPGFRPDGRRIPFLRRFRRLDRWFRVSGLVGAREPGPLATARHRPEPMKGPTPCHN